MQRLLLDPVHVARGWDPGDLEHSRGDVDDVRELAPQPTCVRDQLRVAHHQQVAGAAEVRGDLLPPIEGAVARPAWAEE